MKYQTPNCGAEGSRAKTLAAPENRPESAGKEADCFLTLCDWPLKFDRDSFCWRTSKRCLFEGWAKYSGRWPSAGMMRNGTCSEQAALARHTDEKEYSLLPTPKASDYRGGCFRAPYRSNFPEWVTRLTGLPLPNPLALEQIMGFPITWTELQHSETP